MILLVWLLNLAGLVLWVMIGLGGFYSGWMVLIPTFFAMWHLWFLSKWTKYL